MKKIISCLVLFCCTSLAYTQPLPDSVLTKYRLAKTSQKKGECIYQYMSSVVTADSMVTPLILNLSSWFKKQNDQIGIDYTNLMLSGILIKKGDIPAGLELLLPIAARFEERNDTTGIVSSYRSIANAYFYSKNYEKAAEYLKKTIPLAPTDEVNAKLSRIYNGIACFYGEGGMADSGMVYAQKAVGIDEKLKNVHQLAVSISTLAENYIAAGEYDIALPFLRKSLNFYLTKQVEPENYLFSYLKNDFAQVFLATQQYDSSIYYSYESLQISVPHELKEQSMRSYEYLYKSFEKINKQDSVNKYFRLAMTTKDSLFNMEKMRTIEALSFREELRQREMETEKLKAEEERQENIQLALTALGIVCLIILFLLLSRTIITNTKVIEYFGVIALLIVFEFLNLLLHPFLERITHHTPVLMLLALVSIAALLVPMHHKLEKWATHKLVEKNKAIRLAEAKKTIEKLEKEKNK